MNIHSHGPGALLRGAMSVDADDGPHRVGRLLSLSYRDTSRYQTFRQLQTSLVQAISRWLRLHVARTSTRGRYAVTHSLNWHYDCSYVKCDAYRNTFLLSFLTHFIFHCSFLVLLVKTDSRP